MYKKVAIVASAPLTLERPPPALSALAGICEYNQVDYEIFDLNIYLFQNLSGEDYSAAEFYFTKNSNLVEDSDLAKKIIDIFYMVCSDIQSINADLLAITSFSSVQNCCAKKFLEIFRSLSNITVIAGGPGIFYQEKDNISVGKTFSQLKLIDYYVLGEGDIVFHKFLKGDIELGVNGNQDKYDNWVPQIDDLNQLILPSYKKINFENYKSPHSNDKIALVITGSRGCVRRCTFCDVGNIWKKFRFRNADSLITEIQKHFYDTGCLDFMFSDSLINGSLKQFKDLMIKIIELKKRDKSFEDIRYAGQFIIRPKNQHPEEIFELMAMSGCDHLDVGIETGSDRVRFHMGKKFLNEDIDYHFEMCEKYKLKNQLLMFTAYPTETLEDHKETLNFLTKYQKFLINETIIGISLNSPAAIYKNTPLDQMRHELGLEFQDMEYENVANWITTKNPELTIKERWRRYIELLRQTSNLRYPRTQFDHLMIEMNIDLFKNQKKFT